MAGSLRKRIPLPIRRALLPAVRVARRLRAGGEAPAIAAAAPPRQPSLSIVVPVYDVEHYLASSLDSVLAQTLRDIEVVVVDDASNDGSRAIIQDYAARDDRVVAVYLDDNRGLSGARNAGIAQARGRYLSFIDSDDQLMRDAAKTVVETLDRTGSDLLVYGYERFNTARRWAAPPWICDIHATTRLATTSQEFPQVLANAVAWSKVYRRSFWDDAGLTFPEGVRYEDQPVSALAYARAGSIDVLGDVLIRWRDREDGTSISQQIGTVDDLEQRLDAAHTSLAHLRDHGGEAARALVAQRLEQLLANDFTFSLTAVPRASVEYWDHFRAALTSLFALPEFDESMWASIPPHAAVGYWLTLRGDRDAVVTLLDAGAGSLKNFPSEIVDGVVYARLPFFDDPQVGVPRELFALLPRHRELMTAARRVYWRGEHELVVEGWAYIDNVDHSRDPITLTAELVAPGATVPLEIESILDREVSRVSAHRWSNYESAGYRLVIDTAQLVGRQDRAWGVRMTGVASGVEATADLGGRLAYGSAGRLVARDLPSDWRATPSFTREGLFSISLDRPTSRVEQARWNGSALELAVGTRAGELKSLRARRAGELVDVPMRADERGRWAARLVLPPSGTDDTDKPWWVRAVTATGKEIAVVLPDGMATVGSGGRAFRTAAGNLGLDSTTTQVQVAEARVEGTRLHLLVRVEGTSLDGVELVTSGPVRLSSGPVDLDEGDHAIAIDLEASRWGGPRLPVPVGKYELRLEGAGHLVKLGMARSLVEATPVLVEEPRLHARLEPSGSDRLTIVVIRPIPSTDRGYRRHRELQQWHAEREPQPRPGAFLLRSYYGENTACNAAAVHHELRRRDPSTPIYWAITDYSVAVPEGGIGVVHESREWYELLRDAEFVMDNMHQPIYHAKSEHQKVIATFHGYPFKQMGHAHWERLEFTSERIESFDRRAREWDYLVSPAGYATPLLREAFRFDGRVLEVGYPRNDVLFGAAALERRAEVRERLGIREDQTVTLYAPTFRDYLSTDDYKAPRLDLVNLEAVAENLGDSHVLLMRGHAFNARAGGFASYDRVVDVTSYPDVADLYLAADAAIMDYSSARFDFAHTGKPMIFLVPDLERYLGARGWLMDYEPTAPGPHVSTAEELEYWLQHLGEASTQFKEQYETFIAEYAELDDGRAARRLLDVVIDATP